MKKRILAWIALIIFLALFVNILFIHFMVTESLTIMMLYVLFFFYYKKRQDRMENTITGNNSNETDETDETGVSNENTQ